MTQKAKSMFIPDEPRKKEFVLPRSKVKVVYYEATVKTIIEVEVQKKQNSTAANQNLISFSQVCTFNGEKVNAGDLEYMYADDYNYLLDQVNEPFEEEAKPLASKE